MARLIKRKLRLKQRLRHALEEFFVERMGEGGDMEVSIVDDLILLRCKKAISPSEVALGAIKVGRLLPQEVSERLCQELQPDLGRLLYRITGLRLVDACVGLLLKRRDKVYLLTMSNTVKRQAQITNEHMMGDRMKKWVPDQAP